jgi:transposase InsO family protein
MDVVGGVCLADGTSAKILTGIDDHSRFVVCAGMMTKATSRAVCGHLAHALRAHGVPQEILTDNAKVFTGRFAAKDIEVLFDRICPRERNRPSPHGSPQSHHDRQDRALSPDPSSRVPHRSDLR